MLDEPTFPFSDIDVAGETSVIIQYDEIVSALVNHAKPLPTGTVVTLPLNQELGLPYQVSGGYGAIIEVLLQRVQALEVMVQNLSSSEKTGSDVPLEVRALSKNKARAEIKAYFQSHHGETLYSSEVAAALTLDYDLVAGLMKDLEENGQIAKTEG